MYISVLINKLPNVAKFVGTGCNIMQNGYRLNYAFGTSIYTFDFMIFGSLQSISGRNQTFEWIIDNFSTFPSFLNL